MTFIYGYLPSPDGLTSGLSATERLTKFFGPLDTADVGRHNDDIPMADQRHEVIHEQLPGFQVVHTNPPGILIRRQIMDI